MSPRPAASRHDASARQFLDTAASLIDAAMSEGGEVPPRLRSIKFPAALEWIRVEDVVRLAGGAPGASRKAFWQRWETRDQFLADAVVYTLRFADRPADEYAPLTDRLPGLDPDHLGDAVASLAGDLLTYAESSPRSYLMLHIGTLLHRHPATQREFATAWVEARQPFLQGYVALLSGLGLGFRPGWTPERFDKTLHALVDGFLLQGRIRPDAGEDDAWSHVDLFAEAVVSLTLGALDLGPATRSARDALSGAVRERR